MKLNRNIVIVIVSVLFIQSCTVEKSAFKNKAQETQAKDLLVNKEKATFDFSTIDTENHEFTFSARDASEFMHIITSSGDTIQALNTDITKKSTKTKTSNNITSTAQESKTDKTVIEAEEVIKSSEKKETLSSTFILYIVLGVVVIFSFLGGIALFLMYKSLNKNAAVVSSLLAKMQ